MAANTKRLAHHLPLAPTSGVTEQASVCFSVETRMVIPLVWPTPWGGYFYLALFLFGGACGHLFRKGTGESLLTPDRC